ncbi:MAG: YdiU family protein [Betaproteobacteria bacterium]|nr:YdiU family protein [Betaproteobacteria bacterium]
MTLDALRWDNSYARLPAEFHTRLQPTPLPAPYAIAFNPQAAALIGLDPAQADAPEFIQAIAGNRVPGGAEPLSAVYAGHQFGHFVPQLGDGRAILLGEIRGPDERRWDLQLKGAGLTPYSRMGDGRAVLRSTIREYLCSEAMHGLGIPSTRALAIVGSDAPVRRETMETAAVLARMAPSHVRFGSFELFYHRRQFAQVRALADYVIDEHYPQLRAAERPHAALLAEIVHRTAVLLAQWQAVGFCHGVMNTDNMSVLGLTIDYGPYGFLDGFDRNHVCNHSDESGRYAYDMQPRIAHWNLYCLGQAMLPLMEMDEAEAVLQRYEPLFQSEYAARMRAKLGLATAREDDAALVTELLDLMHASRTDFTILFRSLSGFDSAEGARNTGLRDQFTERERFDAWAVRYAARLRAEGSRDAERRARMDAVNPLYVLRNWMAEEAIEDARERREYAKIEDLRRLLSRPFEDQPGSERYAGLPPDWATRISVAALPEHHAPRNRPPHGSRLSDRRAGHRRGRWPPGVPARGAGLRCGAAPRACPAGGSRARLVSGSSGQASADFQARADALTTESRALGPGAKPAARGTAPCAKGSAGGGRSATRPPSLRGRTIGGPGGGGSRRPASPTWSVSRLWRGDPARRPRRPGTRVPWQAPLLPPRLLRPRPLPDLAEQPIRFVVPFAWARRTRCSSRTSPADASPRRSTHPRPRRTLA